MAIPLLALDFPSSFLSSSRQKLVEYLAPKKSTVAAIGVGSRPIANKFNPVAARIADADGSHPVPAPGLALASTRSTTISTPSTRIRPGAALAEVPKIVYVDRQASSRKLWDNDQEDLLIVLKEVEMKKKARVEHVKWEELTPEDQIRVMFDADVSKSNPISCGQLYGGRLSHQLGDV